MTAFFKWAPAVAVLLPLSASGQNASSDALLEGGKVLLTQLKGDSESDAAVFRQAGADRAQQLLQAVVNRGLEKTATLDEWTGLHRAYDGLVALEIIRHNPAKAALYASFNDAYYRSLEENYEAGLASARKALELNREAGEPLHLAHKAIGEDLRSLGRLPEALQEFREAEQALPDMIDKTAGALGREILETLMAEGKRAEAEQQAAQMLRLAIGAPPIFQARAQLGQADVLFADGKYEAGMDAVKRAVEVTAGTSDADSSAWEAAADLAEAMIGGLGRLSYDEALKLAKLADAQVPGLPIQVAPFAQSIIRQRRRLAGDVDGVLREDVARVEAARQSGNLGELAESLQSLAASYAYVNGMRQRAAVLEEAVETEKQLFPASGVADYAVLQSSYLSVLNALGETYIELGQASPARRAFDTVLKTYASLGAAAIQKQLRSQQEEAVMGTADALALDDDPDGACDMLRKLLGTVSPANRPLVLLALGRTEQTLDEKPTAAVEAYEQAIQGLHAALDYQQEVAARLTLARYLATKAASRVPGARPKALEQLAAGETVAHSLQFADAEWRVDYIYGVLAEADKPQAAIERYRQAVAKLDRLRAGLSRQEQRQSFLDNESVSDLYTRLISLLTRAGLRDDAWQYLERAKARSFLEALQGRRFAAESGTSAVAGLRDLEKRMTDLRVQLLPENVPLLRTAGREPALLRLELRDLEAKFTLAREQDNLSRSRSGQVLSLQPPPIAQIQKALGPHAVLLEYGLLNNEVTAFVVTATSADQLAWKTDTNKLRHNVLGLRGLLADPRSTEWPALLDQVSKTLMTPVAARIPPGTRQILVAPAGYLNDLPFPVLSLPDGRALVEAHAVSLVPSAAALLYLGPGTQAAGELFLGALGKSVVEGMPPLPGTLAETAGIAAEYPHARLASGEAFTHDAAVGALLSADTVHFATHGILEEEAPLFSALLTSPAAEKPSRLSLYEIVGMHLRSKLVVLSACETGLGKLQAGDEITGLTRTFLAAGADTVVASLWKVSDESTAVLMKEFYRRLSTGLAPAAALRESALAVRAKYRHPFYWAPFVATGRN
jgi:CHAT domain-containing protein